MNIFERIKRALTFHPKNPSYWAKKFWGGLESEAGVTVSEESAMKYSAVYGCVRILSEAISSLPLNIYRRAGEGKKKDTAHNLYHLLHDQPNEDMSSYTWRELAMAHILLWGNHYSLLKRDGYNRVQEIYPAMPWMIKPERISIGGKKVKVFRYQPDEGAQQLIDANYVLHIPGLSYDGLQGITPLEWYREQIGLGIAMQTYSSKFFLNGMHSGGVFTTPQALSEDTYNRLKKELEEKFAGLGKAHKTMLLEQELKFDRLSVNPNDAQLLESKKFQIEEIARIFRVPLHLLQSLDRATNNNIEHQGIDFVVHSLRPWLVRIEQAYNMQLLPSYERKTHFTEHIVDGLLRGDIESRYKAYAVGRSNGWLSADDIRALENMNPLPSGQGKVYFAPLNMVPLDQLSKVSEQRIKLALDIESRQIFPKALEAPKMLNDINYRSSQTRYRLSQSYRPLLENVSSRILKRETRDILKEAKKLFAEYSKENFYLFLEDYYQKHTGFVLGQSKSIFADLGKAIALEAATEVGYDLSGSTIDNFLDSYGSAFAIRHVEKNRNRIIKVIEKGLEENIEPYDILEVEFEDWTGNRPAYIANKESIKLTGATSRFVYGAAGILTLVWRNMSGKPCPFCESLNGQKVGISQPFFLAGSEFRPEGADGALSFRTDINHGPIHDGCQCIVEPT